MSSSYPMRKWTSQRLWTQKEFPPRLRRRGTTLRHHVVVHFGSGVGRFGFGQFFRMTHLTMPVLYTTQKLKLAKKYV